MTQPNVTVRRTAGPFDHDHAAARLDRLGARKPPSLGGITGPRVFLVDDDERLRTRIRELLEDDGITVVGDASSGSEALALVPGAVVAGPVVVVMDVRMQGRLNGIEATRLLVQALGATVRVVMFTGFPDPGIEQAARTAGATAVLLKGDPAQHLLAAIHAAWDKLRVAAR